MFSIITSFFKGKLAIVVFLAIAGLLTSIAIVFNLYTSKIASEAVARAEIENLREGIAIKEKSLREAERLLEEHTEMQKNAEAVANKWKFDWDEEKRNEKTCSEWADTKLPDCATDRVRHGTD